LLQHLNLDTYCTYEIFLTVVFKKKGERTLVGKLNKRLFWVYQDLVYPVIGLFGQILSTLKHTDAA